MNSTLLCTFHACPMTCQAQECQLLAYVKELERDKARLDWLDETRAKVAYFGNDCHVTPFWPIPYSTIAKLLRRAIDAAMKEGK